MIDSATFTKEQVQAFASCIVQNQLIATEEETEAFFKTDRGERIRAIFDEIEKKDTKHRGKE